MPTGDRQTSWPSESNRAALSSYIVYPEKNSPLIFLTIDPMMYTQNIKFTKIAFKNKVRQNRGLSLFGTTAGGKQLYFSCTDLLQTDCTLIFSIFDRWWNDPKLYRLTPSILKNATGTAFKQASDSKWKPQAEILRLKVRHRERSLK